MSSKIIRQIPDCGSDDNAWITFHKAAKSRFGKKKANQLWSLVWGKRTEETSTFSSDKANTERLRSYMKKQGVEIEASTLSTIGESVGGYFDFLFDAGKTIYYIVIAIIILIVIGLIAFVYNAIARPEKIEKLVSTAAKVRTGGFATA